MLCTRRVAATCQRLRCCHSLLPAAAGAPALGALGPAIGPLGPAIGALDGHALGARSFAAQRETRHRAGGSPDEIEMLARLARAKSTPFRVVLKQGNTNIKAAIVDDQRDLTVASASTLEPRVKEILAGLFEQDRQRLESLDMAELRDFRLEAIAPESPLLSVPPSRNNHCSDRSAVALVRAAGPGPPACPRLLLRLWLSVLSWRRSGRSWRTGRKRRAWSACACR